MKVLDLDALHGARMAEHPYAWGAVARSFADGDAARELAQTFPDEGFEWHAQRQLLVALGRGDSPEARRHAVRTRALIERGEDGPFEAEALADVWRALAADLLSAEYRAALGACTGRDLSGCPMQTHFWRYEVGSRFDPHVDKAHKVVTHLIYLNEEWDASWGGCLRILRSGDIEDVAHEVVPTAGQAAVLVRCERAWHAVSELQPGHGSRKVLQTWFWG